MLGKSIAKAITATKGFPTGVNWADCGDVRFKTPNGAGGWLDCVFLYAVKRSDGIFDIGLTTASLFDKTTSKVIIATAFLDRIPSNGEMITDWLPNRSKEDSAISAATGYRFLRDNHLKGDVIALVRPEWAL